MVTSIGFDLIGLDGFEGSRMVLYPTDGGKQIDVYLSFADGSEVPFPFDEIKIEGIIGQPIPTRRLIK